MLSFVFLRGLPEICTEEKIAYINNENSISLSNYIFLSDFLSTSIYQIIVSIYLKLVPKIKYWYNSIYFEKKNHLMQCR